MHRAAPQAISWTINNMADVVSVRRYGLKMALSMNFPAPEATKIAVVISELARNILLYAGEGTITLTPDHENVPSIEVIAEDQGPGIENIDLVLQGGYTTSKGLGKGVSGSKRLVDEFEIHSVVGQGTTIRAKKYLPRRSRMVIF